MEQDLFIQVEDEEWDRLRANILEERIQYNLTITDFLVSCGLNHNRTYFRQLCCRTPQLLHPSKRRKSPGLEFRDAAGKYFAEKASPVSISQSLETIIFDWCLDNRPHLQQSRISSIRLIDPNSSDLIVLVYKGCSLSDADILRMLMADSHISSCLASTGSDLRVACRGEAQLLALASPVCVKTGESLGTATLVNVDGCVVALTCAHVLEHVFGSKVSFCDKDIPTNKFKRGTVGSFFGYGFSNKNTDIAGVLPAVHLPLIMNEVEEVAVPVKLTKWWKQEKDSSLQSRIDYLAKSAVTKCGISSRTTTGEVVHVAGDVFFVKENEVTPFSVPGDSGSLVLNAEGEVVGIVSEIAQFGERYVTEVLPVWEFYDWLSELRHMEAK